jgi:hypothetical protein
MIIFEKTIDSFRRGLLDIDCKRMVLSARKQGGDQFEGQGYIRQSEDGALTLKIYVTQHTATPYEHFTSWLAVSAGRVHSDDMYYDLDATGHDGTRWTAKRILPAPRWDASDASVLMKGQIQSITAHLDMPIPQHFLQLHFFEEYVVPLHRTSRAELDGQVYLVRDRDEFDACGSKFEIRRRAGSGETIVEAVSDNPFPPAFDLRIQEALQYITAKTAMWRARVQSNGQEQHLELVSPWRKAQRTQFDPPISPAAMEFHQYGWNLFGKYLAYVVARTDRTHWNPMAYHLYNACEATGGSLDAWAVGVSVAVEAVASLIEGDAEKDERIAQLQDRMRTWLAGQSDLQSDLANRVKGLIDALSEKRTVDALYELAATGHAEEDYIKAWRYLRNRHVHPKLSDLNKPDQIDYQRLIDNIHRVEVLLRQLTFYLIGYEGPFTDYGVHGGQTFPLRQYPLRLAREVGLVESHDARTNPESTL